MMDAFFLAEVKDLLVNLLESRIPLSATVLEPKFPE
jgi:hypothetical protein